MSDERRPERLCEEVLALVGQRAEAEASAATGRSALTRFANSHIHQNVAEDTVWVRLRAAIEGRQAAMTTNRHDPQGLANLVDATLEAVVLRPPDPDWPGLAPPVAAAPVDHYDEATHRAAPERRAEVVGNFVAAGPDLEAAGYCDSVGSILAFANSAGQRLAGRWSRATVDAIHRTGSSDGCGWATSARLADLSGAEAGRRAAAKARAAADPVDLEPGRYEVVLEPRCVADMVEFLTGYGFNAKAYAEERSFVRLGERQLDPSIELWDDAADPRAVGVGFDAEGTPKRRVDLVRGGVPTALVHDRRTARRLGAESTGHALPGGELYGPWADNLFLAPGTADTAELVGAVEHGLLVSDFWYTRILDPKTQVVTGLTRNGTFLIRAGEVVGGVRNLRFTQSYVEALAPGHVLGVGRDTGLVNGSCCVPSLRLAAWNFTGGAQG